MGRTSTPEGITTITARLGIVRFVSVCLILGTNQVQVGCGLGEVSLDAKYRIHLDKKTRAIAGIKKRDRLVAIAFKGGVILVRPRGRKFAGSLPEFGFKEEEHEASRFIFRRRS